MRSNDDDDGDVDVFVNKMNERTKIKKITSMHIHWRRTLYLTLSFLLYWSCFFVSFAFPAIGDGIAIKIRENLHFILEIDNKKKIWRKKCRKHTHHSIEVDCMVRIHAIAIIRSSIRLSCETLLINTCCYWTIHHSFSYGIKCDNKSKKP